MPEVFICATCGKERDPEDKVIVHQEKANGNPHKAPEEMCVFDKVTLVKEGNDG